MNCLGSFLAVLTFCLAIWLRLLLVPRVGRTFLIPCGRNALPVTTTRPAQPLSDFTYLINVTCFFRSVAITLLSCTSIHPLNTRQGKMTPSREHSDAPGQTELLIQRPLTHSDAESSESKLPPVSQPIPEPTLSLRLWKWEIGYLIASLSCLVATLVVLLVYNNRGVPKLPFSITFNAVISVLVTAAKWFLLPALKGAMGHMK